MKSKATTVEEYLAELPEDRREAIAAVRDTIVKNLPKGYEETVQYGAIGYVVPHSVYPPGYHCDPSQPVPFGGIANQKNHIGIYLMCIYNDPKHEEWFREAWKKTGKKLDMGKSCIRFRKLEDVPLKVIGQAFKRVSVKKFVEHYELALSNMKSRKKPKAAATKTAKKTAAPKANRPSPKAAQKKAVKKTTKKSTARRTAKR